MTASASIVTDIQVRGVLDRLHGQAKAQFPGLVAHYALQMLGGLAGRKRSSDADAAFHRDKLIPIDPGQGDLIYLLCLSLRATRVVEFGTSFGVSTLYLAAAVRDQGGGVVIGTELEPTKAARAREHFAQAGVSDLIDLREGDALETLKDCGGPVDFLLIDGWPRLARPVLELMAPQLRSGAIVICDNVGHFPREFADYLSFVRDPANGFASSLLPLRSGTEMSVRL